MAAAVAVGSACATALNLMAASMAPAVAAGLCVGLMDLALHGARSSAARKQAAGRWMLSTAGRYPQLDAIHSYESGRIT